MNAKCALSDSGTISEESAILNFPAVTIRNSMERPEAIDAGTIILTGLNPKIVLDSVRLAIDEHTSIITPHSLDTPKHGEGGSLFTQHSSPNNYNVENTSWRVLKIIMGTTKLNNKWWGITEK